MYESDTSNQTLKLPDFGFHLPELMPDEFFSGYFGRFSQLNGFKNVNQAKVFIKTNIKRLHPKFKYVPAIWGMAQIHGVDVNVLIQQHTLLPLLARISKPENKIPPNKLSTTLNYLYSCNINHIKAYPCLCTECTKEDVGYWGFSYWRRSHQLPGVDWCTKHNTPLVTIDVQDAFSRIPSWFIHQDQDEFIVSQATKPNQFQQKYIQIIQDACEINFPLDHKIMKALLMQALTKKLGPRPRSDIFNGLDQLMTHQLPIEWMQSHFPKLISQYQNNGVNRFYNMLESNSNAKTLINYMLMAAVLFDNGDDAMLTIIKQHKEQAITSSKNLDSIDAHN